MKEIYRPSRPFMIALLIWFFFNAGFFFIGYDIGEKRDNKEDEPDKTYAMTFHQGFYEGRKWQYDNTTKWLDEVVLPHLNRMVIPPYKFVLYYADEGRGLGRGIKVIHEGEFDQSRLFRTGTTVYEYDRRPE